jgi:probable rRNA maturation factor
MLTKVNSLVSEANITVENRTDINVNLYQIVRLVNFCRQQLGLPTNISIDVTFVGEAIMSDLHIRHMGLSGSTDVLSFPSTDVANGPVDPTSLQGQSMLGDIVICPSFVARNAQFHPTKMNIDACVIHAMLHLIGHDHFELHGQRNMSSLEHLISSSWAKSRAKRGRFALARRH